MPKPPTQPPAAWTETYPEMLRVLDAVIKANRGARSRVDVQELKRVHRDLTQLDPAASSFAAFRLVRHVVNATPLGHPAAGAILRLAADLADLNDAARRAVARLTTPESSDV